MIYIGSSPLKNCFVGSTQVKEIYVGSTLYWSSKKTLSVTLNGNSTAVLKIGGTTAGTYTKSFTYEIPYGSSVTLTVTADTYYYFPAYYNNTKTYTYSSFEEDTSLSLTAEKLSFKVYIYPAMRDDATISGKTYGGRLNVLLSYKTPGSSSANSWLLPTSSFYYTQNTGSYPNITHTTVYTTGPWTCDKNVAFGTTISPTAGTYGTSNSSTIVTPYYYASDIGSQDPAKYGSYYKEPGVAATTTSNWFTPGKTNSTNFYLYYIPYYSKISGRINYSGYTNSATSSNYYLHIKVGDITVYSGKTSNVQTYYTMSSLKIPAPNGAPPTITFSICNSSGSYTYKTKTVTIYGDTTNMNVTLSSTGF